MRRASFRELRGLTRIHDVFLVMADARFAYHLPSVSAGWVEAYDVETGRTGVFSRASCSDCARAWRSGRQEICRLARDADLDLVSVGLDRWEMETTLAEFAAERRLRKRCNMRTLLTTSRSLASWRRPWRRNRAAGHATSGCPRRPAPAASPADDRAAMPVPSLAKSRSRRFRCWWKTDTTAFASASASA